MQIFGLVVSLVAAHTQRVDARFLEKSQAGNCPSGLSVLRRIELERVDWVGGAGTTTEFKVAEVPNGTKVMPGMWGLGPSFQKGYRYLLFDAVRSGGLVGVGCQVQSKIRCLAAPSASQQPSTAACGTACHPDTSDQGLHYVPIQIGGAVAAWAEGRSGSITQPSSAVVVGVGAGSIPSWFAQAFPNTHLDVVDFEPEVIRAAVDCFGLPASGGRIQHHAMEGVAFLRSQSTQYNLVFLDVPPLPAGFVEAVPTIRARLAPGGVLAVNGFETDKRWPQFIQAVACSFPSVWLDGGKGNQVLVASTEQRVSLADWNSTTIASWGVSAEVARWAVGPHWRRAPACNTR